MTDIKEEVFKKIYDVIEDKTVSIADDTPLLGDGAALDSLNLVELCVGLEDLAGEIGFDFDWTSEMAMSKSRSMFRTAGTLATEFCAQKDAQK